MGTGTILTTDTPVAETTETDTPVAETTETDTPVAETTETDTPVEYKDFDLPDGVSINDEVMGQAAELFKEANLTKEQAQKFIDMQVSLNSGAEAANEAVRTDWVNKAKSDKEYGGDNFDQSVGVAMQAVEKFGTPELKQMLNETGVGNHPEMIRLLKRVGDLTLEDTPTNISKVPGKELSTLEIMYK